MQSGSKEKLEKFPHHKQSPKLEKTSQVTESNNPKTIIQISKTFIQLREPAPEDVAKNNNDFHTTGSKREDKFSGDVGLDKSKSNFKWTKEAKKNYFRQH